MLASRYLTGNRNSLTAKFMRTHYCNLYACYGVTLSLACFHILFAVVELLYHVRTLHWNFQKAFIYIAFCRPQIHRFFFYQTWKFSWNFRLPMSPFSRNTLLEHQLFTRIFAFKRFYVSIAVANSKSSKSFVISESITGH